MSGTTFVVAPGTDHIAQQAKWLIRSIERYGGDYDRIVSFFSEGEYTELSDRSADFFEDRSTVVRGEIPIPDHPISAKIAALREAEEFEASGRRVLLDADMLVINEFDIESTSHAELRMKPVDIGWNQWGGHQSRRNWEEVYRIFNRDFPGFLNRSTVDQVPIPPYWNSGTVVAETEIAEQWLEMTEKILTAKPNEFFADQLALAVLSSDYRVEQLTEQYNFPLHLRCNCPSDIRVIHHHGLENLRRIPNAQVRTKIDELGIYQSDATPGIISTVLSSRSMLRSVWRTKG